MEEKETYRAGFCNIGKEELSIRKKLFTFSFLLTLLFTWITLCYHTQLWMMFLLFVSVFFTILLFIEIRLKFCILFGLFNLYNFRQPGHLDTVTNRDHSKKDRSKALQIISVTTLAAGIFTYLHFLLSVYIYC